MNDYFPQDNGIGVRIGNGVKQDSADNCKSLYSG